MYVEVARVCESRDRDGYVGPCLFACNPWADSVSAFQHLPLER